MENRTISFEDLPQATSALQGEVKALRSAVEQLVVEIKSSKGNRGRHDWRRRSMQASWVEETYRLSQGAETRD